MSTTTTAIILKDTNHVLAAYTQKSGAKEPLSSKQLEERFVRNGLQLRYVERRLPSEIVTKSQLSGASTKLEISSTEMLAISEGDRLLVQKGSDQSIVRITKIDLTTPLTATIDIIVERKPSSSINDATATFIDRSPSNEPFQIASRFLSSVLIPPDAIDIKRQPSAFVVNNGKPDLVPAVPDSIKNIEFSVQLTGVRIVVTTKASKTMDSDIPVVCVLRTAKGENVVSTATIPKVPQNSTKTEATIPFAAFPSGDNLFLFMLKGFNPLWDRLPVNGKRTWTPIST